VLLELISWHRSCNNVPDRRAQGLKAAGIHLVMEAAVCATMEVNTAQDCVSMRCSAEGCSTAAVLGPHVHTETVPTGGVHDGFCMVLYLQ
jgi:hypothetical protein